jgi:hypothetical protein
MPIIPNTLNQQTNPLFKSFTPYTIGVDEVVCDYVSDMVSVDMAPRNPATKLNYDIGAENTYSDTMFVKNLTSNTSLKIELIFDEQIFYVSKNSFELGPNQETTIDISLNKNGLNTLPGLNEQIKEFTLKVTNLNNGTLIVKNTKVPPHVKRELPETIVVR